MSDIPQIKLLDSEGYPTEEWINYIKNFVPTEEFNTTDFVEELLSEGWWRADWGFYIQGKNRRRTRKVELHTGGWSGNEEIISAILSNIHLTHFRMRYVMWKTGGHYYFEIKEFNGE